jgi:hypothetical protein
MTRLTTTAALLLAMVARAEAPSVVAEVAAPVVPGPNVLMVEAGDLFGGVARLEYERAVHPRLGLTVGLSAATFPSIFAKPGSPFIGSAGAELGARLHLVGDAPAGAWLSLSATGAAVLARNDGPVTRPWSWGLDAAFGYTAIYQGHFAFQFGLGGGFVDSGERVVWSPRFVLGLGSAF